MGRRGVVLEDAIEPEGGDWIRLPLELKRLDLANLDRRAGELPGLQAKQDLPGLGRLLEACRDVYGVAGHERMRPSGVTRDDPTVFTPVRVSSRTPHRDSCSALSEPSAFASRKPPGQP